MFGPMQPGTIQGPHGMTHNAPQPQGLWGAPQQGGFLSNPLVMGGLMGLSSALGGQGSAPGMAMGFSMAQQRNDNAWSRQMQALQMQKLQRDMQRQDEQEARLNALTGNPQLAKMGIDPSLWAALPTAGKVKVATDLLTATPEAPTTYQDQLGATRYLTGPNAGGLVPGEIAQAPDEPEPWRQKFQLWKSENPEGTYTDYLAATRTPLIGSLWGDPTQPQGGMTEDGSWAPPPPGQTYTAEQVTDAGLDPSKVWMTNAKTGRPIAVGNRGEAPLSGEASSRYALMKGGLTDAKTAYDYLFPDGEFSRSQWIASFVPGSDAAAGRNALKAAIRAKLRIESGAQISDKEIDQEAEVAMPGITESDTVVRNKLQRVIRFLYGGLEGLGRTDDAVVGPEYFTFGKNPGPLKQPPPGAVITEEDL